MYTRRTRICKHTLSRLYVSTGTYIQVGRPTQVNLVNMPATRIQPITRFKPPVPDVSIATTKHTERRSRGVTYLGRRQGAWCCLTDAEQTKYRASTEQNSEGTTKRITDETTNEKLNELSHDVPHEVQTKCRTLYRTKHRTKHRRNTEQNTERSTERTCCIPTRGWSRRSSPSLPRPSRR